MSFSALPLGCREESSAHPVGERLPSTISRRDKRGVLVVGGSQALDVAARVFDGRPAGSGAHAMRIAATESIDNADFSGHNKYMTTTAAKATIKTVGQFLYLVSIDRKGNERVEFIGGEGDRSYGEKLAAYRNGQTR